MMKKSALLLPPSDFYRTRGPISSPIDNINSVCADPRTWGGAKYLQILQCCLYVVNTCFSSLSATSPVD